MKKLFLTAAFLMAFGLGCIAQEANNNVTVTKDGKTFYATKNNSNNEGKGYTPTGYT